MLRNNTNQLNHLAGRSIALVMLALIALFSQACDRTRHDKGYEYFPDMAHSLAYETYSSNPNFADGSTMRTPPEGTIPRDMIPYRYPASAEGRELAGKELVNPLPVDAEILESGKAMYTIFCQSCHGDKGDGKGILHTSGKYAIPPSSLITDDLKQVPQGEIYHVITAGWGVMGAHGVQIKPEDRWKIIHFIEKSLQGK